MTIGNIIIDVVLVLIMGAIIFASIKRGFVKSFFKMAKIVIVIILVAIFGSLLTGVMSDLFVADMLEDKISVPLVEFVEARGGDVEFDEIMQILPVAAQNALPREELEAKFESLSADATTNAYEFGRGIELTLINMISKALSYVAVFLIAYILCTIAVFLLDKFCKLPVLSQLNTILGTVWGIAYAYVFASFAVFIITLLFGANFVSDTFVARIMYNIGLFTN